MSNHWTNDAATAEAHIAHSKTLDGRSYDSLTSAEKASRLIAGWHQLSARAAAGSMDRLLSMMAADIEKLLAECI